MPLPVPTRRSRPTAPIPRPAPYRQRPVVYLDVDGVALTFSPTSPRGIAPAYGRFVIRWMLAWCDVRWLTSWAEWGAMDSYSLEELAHQLGLHPDELLEIDGLPWRDAMHTFQKTDAIAYVEHLVEQRPWVWLDDEISDQDRAMLALAGQPEGHLLVDGVTDRWALFRAWKTIVTRFGLPPVLPDGRSMHEANRRVGRRATRTSLNLIWNRHSPDAQRPIPTSYQGGEPPAISAEAAVATGRARPIRSSGSPGR